MTFSEVSEKPGYLLENSLQGASPLDAHGNHQGSLNKVRCLGPRPGESDVTDSGKSLGSQIFEISPDDCNVQPALRRSAFKPHGRQFFFFFFTVDTSSCALGRKYIIEIYKI